MALGPRLDLRQSQSLVMTPQLQQAIKLLALSNLEIETFIGEALEANPLLEAGEMRVEDRDAPDEAAASEIHDATPDSDAGEQALDIDVGSLDRDRDTGDGDWGASGAHAAVSDELPSIEDRSTADTTLAEHLEEQLGPAAGDAREAFIGRHIIGLLDEAGYLTSDLAEIANDLGVGMAEVHRALAVVQSLEPTGVGARSLSECLALQAKEVDRYDPCMARLIDNLDLVARGEISRLKRMCDVDDEDFADMLAELRGYDPKPGLAYGASDAGTVVPDVLVTTGRKGGWDISLNEATLPRLIVNRGYYMELRGGGTDKQTDSWLKEKLADANWLIKALDQRQKTILKTAAEIVKKQEGFFRKGVSELRPLTLREVAEEIDMHESTVSRVTSNKYLHCDRGCFELKYFFSSGVGSSDGEGASAEAIKARIKALIDGEDAKKILSDQKLVDLLKAEGFDLARRTVAKYREAIGIGSSAQRRRQKKLQGL
ncbi:RNA polymerase, sigma 54 subunit, RpoN/SigL [Altererythrobacter xiamenensis]|uniref:RNA polymerase sigma-54 factor n=1 Tax=Altererythrobacter xiamenensis TaxID=1316679 RepID=A0A1Y6F7H1_9SPHN|nr:RNA polymerase factor sigma-54 [Altererythrobacter xiamenensis]SMQ69310.1 RNA polymerase, sigma 54 subunit, RpoN/SigL [Altererythrobacter xiamenensis]